MKKYVVCDECSDNWSDLYDTYSEAKDDLDNNRSYGWSTEAVVEEVEVK